MIKILLNKFMQFYPTFHTAVLILCMSFIASEMFFTVKFEPWHACLSVAGVWGGSRFLGLF